MTLWTLACEISLQNAAEVDQCVNEIINRLDFSSLEDQADNPQAEG